MEHEEEVEVKILEIEKYKVVYDLLKMGADIIFHGTVKTYDFKTSEDGKSFIRLRSMFDLASDTEEYSIIYKDGRESDSSVKLARESKIKNISKSEEEFRQWILFFTMSLPLIHGSCKYRQSLMLDGFRVDIDEYDDIPTFLEIEGPDGESIKTFAKTFMPNIKDEDMKSWGTLELFKHYRSQTKCSE